MPVLRPVAHLENASRDYPGAWRQYAKFISDRAELGDWPSWCYCPMAAAYAIVSGGGANKVPLGRATDIARLAALAAWRPTQGVYRFDSTLLGELLETSLAGDIPVDYLHRLPEWCVYVEMGGVVIAAANADDQLAQPLHGFFAHLEHDAQSERTELRLLLDYDGQMAPTALHLGGTIEESIAGFVAHANVQVAATRAPLPAFGGQLIADIARLATPLVSVLLYLCADESEARPTRDPKRTAERPGIKRNSRGEPHQPAGRPEIWETGFSLGAALRAAQEGEAREGSVRGHVRRAHWHTVLSGPRSDERKRALRWFPPIPVNLHGYTPDPVVRRVRDE